MTDDALRMNRLSLRFADAGVEDSFAVAHAQKSLRPNRIAFTTGADFLAMALTVSIYSTHILSGALMPP